MDQYAGSPGHSTYCYTELAASFINLLHYCLPSSGFYGAGKDDRGRRADNPPGRHPNRTISDPGQLPSLPQPSQLILAWDSY